MIDRKISYRIERMLLRDMLRDGRDMRRSLIELKETKSRDIQIRDKDREDLL